jgi:signal transduction histidine kinase
LQTGKLHFTKEDIRLDELIEETVEQLEGTTKNQSITFSGKNPLTVNADRYRVYQVLNNLITNAAKYSPEGSDITVRLKKIDGKAVVSVSDSGIGISKDQQKKIFDRLYQVVDAEINTFPGLGMGLYISKEIIKRHKGTIWVESEKGKGSTFFFSLPLVKSR